ncbi:uncharacterized protein DUF4402 [Jejuia pallidilutea]|uniref:Uncharacterized protein DUF4402 n=1 Tax=Jejuia pallidilutea TaxID=504487 RepID=A0A362X0P2_9FLAO|nr:uncharacterized protein DUF4402 [Jejuia pallidilutea]
MKQLNLCIILLAVLSTTKMAHAQGTETDDARVTSSIIPAIVCTIGQNSLQFGALSADPNTASTLTLSASSPTTVTVDGVSSIKVYSYLPKSAADFNILGKAGSRFSVTLPSQTTLTNTTEVGVTMTVNEFTSNLSNNIGSLSGSSG